MKANVKTEIFSPVQIGEVEIPSRIVMPAMHLGLSEDGHVTAKEIGFYSERAASGVGLIIVGLCNSYEKSSDALKGALSLSSDEYIDSLKALVESVKKTGAKIALQLTATVGYNNPKFVPSLEEIDEMVNSMGAAAKRAQIAGFDFVEVMLSGGSILSHMLSPCHNTYNIDEYSGTLENRLRFPLESIGAIKRDAPSMPVLVRMHGHEYLEGGYGLDEAKQIAVALENAGVCAINVTVAGHRTTLPQITRQCAPSMFSYLGRNIKDAVSVPVFFGGRIRTMDDAVNTFVDSGADCLTIGRALIADSSWTVKMKNMALCSNVGTTLEDSEDVTISSCLSCCQCLEMAFVKKPVKCTVNQYVQGIPQLPKVGSGKVLIAGSGPAGLKAAVEYAQSGFHVTVWEKENQLGGKLNQVGQLKHHLEMKALRDNWVEKLAALNITVQMNKELTQDAARAFKPDVLIIATGAKARLAKINGIENHPNVMHVSDVLDKRLQFKNLVIMGGNAAGLTAAVDLAQHGYASNEAVGYLARYGTEQWHREALQFTPKRTITILKRRGFLGKGMGRATRWISMKALDLFHVNVKDRVSYEEVVENGVWITNNRTKQREFIEADGIVTATGFDSTNYLLDEYMGIAKHLFIVGDAKEVGNITQAVQSVYAQS